MMSVILVFIAIVEVFAGAIVFLHWFPVISVFLYLGLIYILKGVWSMTSSIFAGYLYDWMGALDFIAGIAMLLIFGGTIFSFFWIIGVAHVLKGLYTFLVSI